MATSTCPKCDGTTFEMKEGKVTGSNFRIMFVQCRSCGAVVGATEFVNVPSMLQKLARKLGVGDII